MLGTYSRGKRPSGQTSFNKQLTSMRYSSAPPRDNEDSVPVIGETKTTPDFGGIFLRGIESLMYSAQLACSVVSWQKAKDTLNSIRNRVLCIQVLWYICFDMATQGYSTQPVFGDGGWNSERLLRFIVLSFANSLSASQRKSVFESFNRKLTRSGAGLGIQDEYFKLLRTVDDLKSYACPKVADSQYMCIVENAVDLLVDMAAGKSQRTHQTKKGTVLLMLLEARFLLFTAAEVYSALSKITKMDWCFREQCEANLREVQRADAELYTAINDIMTKSDESGIYSRSFSSILHAITHSSECRRCAAKEIINNVGGMLDNIKNVETLDTTRLLVRTGGGISISKSQQNGARFVDDLERCLRSRDVSPMGVGLQNHREIVDGVYEMVVHGSSHKLKAQYAERKEWKIALQMPQRNVLCGILCSSVVAYHTKKFVNDLLKRESYRVPGAREIAATEEICTMLDGCQALDKRDHHSIKNRINANEAAFRNMAINICLNLALGDACRVLGETCLATSVNYRVLALYTNMFCNLHPNQMMNSRAELEEICCQYGNKLPREIDDLLCMLTDLKYFSYKSSYTGKDKDYSKDIKEHRSHHSGSVQTTLARLLIHSTCSTKGTGGAGARQSSPVGHLEWLDVLKVLLYECAHMADIYLALANGIKKRNIMKEVRDGALKTLASTRLGTLKDFFENDKEVCNKISKIVEKVDRLFSKEEQHLLSTTYPVNAGIMMKACHDSVWDTANNKRLSGTQIDEQLMAYTICRLYTSARRALHIANSCALMSESRYIPPLSFILNVYFHCEEIKFNKTAGFVHGEVTCDNHKELGASSHMKGIASERNANDKGRFPVTTSHRLYNTHLVEKIPAAEEPSERRHEENSCVVEKVSNMLETVEVENTAASYVFPPPSSISDIGSRSDVKIVDMRVTRVCGIENGRVMESGFGIRRIFRDSVEKHVCVSVIR